MNLRGNEAHRRFWRGRRDRNDINTLLMNENLTNENLN